MKYSNKTYMDEILNIFIIIILKNICVCVCICMYKLIIIINYNNYNKLYNNCYNIIINKLLTNISLLLIY